MGCNNSRKTLQEKSSLNSKELEKCNTKFLKLSRVKPGVEGKSVALEGFRTAFPENLRLADKIYKFIKSQSTQGEVDVETLVLMMELLTKQKSEIYIYMQHYKQLEQYQLLLLVSMQHPSIYRKEEFKSSQLSKLEVTYLQAGIYIKEIINMLSPKGEKLSNDDDVAAKLLINNIFGDKTSNMDLQEFCNRLKAEVPLLNTVIRRYFAGKFTDASSKIRLPEISDESKIINHQILGLFYLSTPWFFQTNGLNLLYKFQDQEDQYDFNQLTNALTSTKKPTVILFRHVERMNKHEKLPYQHTMDENLEAFEQYYHFGFYCSTYWRLAPELTGDRNSSLFSIVPKYQHFLASRGKGQSKFALLNSEQGRPLHPTLARKLNKYGLGIGGSGLEEHRLWLDGQNIRDSYINNKDMTFMEGHVLAPHIQQLCIDRIEIWELEFLGVQQDLSHFRQIQMNQINKILQDDENVQTSYNAADILKKLKDKQNLSQHSQKFEEEKIYGE